MGISKLLYFYVPEHMYFWRAKWTFTTSIYSLLLLFFFLKKRYKAFKLIYGKHLAYPLYYLCLLYKIHSILYYLIFSTKLQDAGDAASR